MAANQARSQHKLTRVEAARRKYDAVNTQVKQCKEQIEKEGCNRVSNILFLFSTLHIVIIRLLD